MCCGMLSGFTTDDDVRELVNQEGVEALLLLLHLEEEKVEVGVVVVVVVVLEEH